MSVALEPYVVPDSIEPITGWRSWHVYEGKLWSINQGAEWPAGEPMRAACGHGGVMQSYWAWTHQECAEPGQLTAQAWEDGERTFVDEQAAAAARFRFAVAYGRFSGAQAVPATPSPPAVPRPPSVVLPFGLYVWAQRVIRHESAPAPECVCGIYAVDRLDERVPGALIVGRVKAWGKIIPGEAGWRAEFAYPEQLYVLSSVPNEGPDRSGVMFRTIDPGRFKGIGRGKARELAHELCQAYQVPVQVVDDREEIEA